MHIDFVIAWISIKTGQQTTANAQPTRTGSAPPHHGVANPWLSAPWLENPSFSLTISPKLRIYIYIKYGSASHLWLPKGIYPKSILIRTHTHVYIYNITMLINRRFIDCYRMEGSSWRSPKNSGPRCDQNWNAGLGEQQRLGQDNPGSTLTVHGHVWDISLSNVGKALIDRPYFDGLESIPTIYGKLKGWATITLPTLYHYKATWNNINSFWIDPCGMRYLQTYQCMSKT